MVIFVVDQRVVRGIGGILPEKDGRGRAVAVEVSPAPESPVAVRQIEGVTAGDQVAHGAAAQATYIWGLYRTASGFRSTPPVFVCEKCTPGKVFIKKDVIMLSHIKRSPFDAQTVSLKFRIADGTLKKIN